MKLIRILVICALFSAPGCVSLQDKSVKIDIDITAGDGIGEDKAREIILYYLADSGSPHGETYEFQLFRCNLQMAEECKADPYYSGLLGVFCACDYLLYEIADPKCYTGRHVIETCVQNGCAYKFSAVAAGECE